MGDRVRLAFDFSSSVVDLIYSRLLEVLVSIIRPWLIKWFDKYPEEHSM